MGGTIDKGAYRAVALTLIRKRPLLVFPIRTELTGPRSPFGSLYWKPYVGLPAQNGLPFRSGPGGSGKVCSVGFSPSTRIVSVAPATVGSPTT